MRVTYDRGKNKLVHFDNAGWKGLPVANRSLFTKELCNIGPWPRLRWGNRLRLLHGVPSSGIQIQRSCRKKAGRYRLFPRYDLAYAESYHEPCQVTWDLKWGAVLLTLLYKHFTTVIYNCSVLLFSLHPSWHNGHSRIWYYERKLQL